jgi:hypothetical protein
MTRALLTVLFLLGCRKSARDDGLHRPALTPAAAARLRNLSPHCAFEASTAPGVAQVQKCTGGRGPLVLQLDRRRRIISLEATIHAAAAAEAKQALVNGLTGLVPPGALANAGARLGKSTVAEAETVDGVQVTVRSAAADGYNLYTVTLAF